MYARRIQDKEFTFDFADTLFGENLLFVDRETESVWSQLEGKAIVGSMQGAPLRVIPALQTTWRFWRERHPETRVMALPGVKGRPYIYRNPRLNYNPTRHDATSLGLGLVAGGEEIFLPFRQLNRASPPFSLQLGQGRVTVNYVKQEFTAWAEDEAGNLLPGVLAYKSGWMQFHPDSKIYRAPKRRQRR